MIRRNLFHSYYGSTHYVPYLFPDTQWVLHFDHHFLAIAFTLRPDDNVSVLQYPSNHAADYLSVGEAGRNDYERLRCQDADPYL